MSARPIQVALTGTADAPLRRLLEDVLQDGPRRCEIADEPVAAPDVVLALVGWHNVVEVLAAARAAAGSAPVLAILPVSDRWLGSNALGAGAHAWFALDTPLRLLVDMVATLARGSGAPTAVR